MWSAGEADDKERFLADLRALRDAAVLEFDELAARAHYPSEVLKEAESGPSLPSLPILAAYVRACDGDVPEWEERWRRLGSESRADPGLPVRHAGASPAAVAGARAGVSVAPPDTYDPERIRAALRGSHGRSDRGTSGTVDRAAPRGVEPDTAVPAIAEQRVPESPASWSAGPGWDESTRWNADAQPGAGTSWDGFQRDARWDGVAADLTGTKANGDHHMVQRDDGSSSTAVVQAPDAAGADAIRRDPFSADWLHDGELTSPPDLEPGSPEQVEAEASAASPDDWFTPRETAAPEPTSSPAGTEPLAAAMDTWFTPRERTEGGPALPQPTARDVAPTERDVAPPRDQAVAIPRASWPVSDDPPTSDALGAAGRTVPFLAPAAASAPPRTIAEPVAPPGPVVPPSRSRPDRLYPVRLLVVIVVAALIGSILVLLLR